MTVDAPAKEQVTDPWTGHNHDQDTDCTKDCPKFVKPAAKKTTRKRGTKPRKSGQSAANEEGEKSADETTEPVDDKVLPEERDEWFRAPGFQRMKTAWEGDDARQMQRVQGVIDKVIFETFVDAYSVMSDIYDIVREPVVNEATGEIQRDPYGFTLWKKHPVTGQYMEDWTRLTYAQREHFLFRIVSSLFEWEQRAADLWTQAMFAKGMFVEKFSIEFDAPIAGTVDDRTARGNKEAAEDRYFALMQAAVSRKSDALIRSMTRIEQRLKDLIEK